MRLHKEGTIIILVATLILSAVALIPGYFLHFSGIIFWLLVTFSVVMLILVIQFFRVPHRLFTPDQVKYICPADGKLVVIEKIIENEYFKEERLQVSIFMSPLNVHINWYPASGTVTYVKHHHGKYLVAWDPKSSTENERTTVVINTGKEEIMVRQIAGAVARRIVCYSKVGDQVKQGDQLGFIKFGSRVDIILPVNTTIDIPLNQDVKGLLSVLSAQ